ncbi:MAG: hypothetical protein JWQ29_1085, partial [Phenylobacterium sp.]|nr:hypothetical protein [Phenylobacterium sp.]
VDGMLGQAHVTQPQLARSPDPNVAAAAQTQATAEKHSDTGPPQVRAAEDGARDHAQAQASGALKTGLAGMGLTRAGAFGQVGGQQSATKTRHEKARQEIATQLGAIQKTAGGEVGRILTEMEERAGQRFDAGLQRALQAFEDERGKLEAEARREQAAKWFAFGFILGAIVGYFWSLGADKVERAVAGARAAYDRVVSQTIDEVAAYVAGRLAEARRVMAKARADADALVAKLPADLQDVGRAARAEVETEFDKLSQSIDAKRDAVIDKLAQAYVAAAKEVDSRVQAFRDANKSLWDRAKEAVGGVIKILLEFKALIMGLLAKAAGVVDSILADPIGFLGNLVAGMKLGVQNFLANILTHLKAGFFSWLFGTLAKAGITMPSSFGVKEIIGLILQVLGLTYANIRARAVTILGEPMVKGLEAAAEIFKVLATEGPAGLWRLLLEKLESLKEQAISQIKEMLITQVIKAGIIWLIGLLNPASALAKACKAIYDIVMFLIERGSQIVELVNAVLDSMAAIAAGNLTAMAKKVEDALAKAVPVAIGFLASLLGLGGLSEKIKAIIDKIQAPVNKAIDWLINKAVDIVKKIGGMLGLKEKPKVDPNDHTAMATEAGGKLDKFLDEEPDLAASKTRFAKEAPALEVGYRAHLQPGIAMKIRLVDEAAATTRDELDYEVLIAPNDTKLKFVKHKSGQKPEVGAYKDLKGKGREAHHAPPVELAISLQDALNTAGQGIMAKDPVTGAMLLGASAKLKVGAASHGANLPAILVDENTHRVKGQGVRIHGSEIRKLLEAELTDPSVAARDDAPETAGGEVAVKPGGAAFRRQIATIAGRETGMKVSTKAGLKGALVAKGKEIVSRAYKGEAARSIAAVEVALAKSTRDGPEADRKAAIGELKTAAAATWEADLLSDVL